MSELKFQVLPEDEAERFVLEGNHYERALVLKVMEGPRGFSIMINKRTIAGPQPMSTTKCLARFPMSAKYLLTVLRDFVKLG